jgi:GntR family transcriptional regulator
VKSLFLKIDFESETPIYIQIKNGIVEGIAKKELLPGDSLPSVRQLAEDIGVNMHTVNKAYGLLKSDEFITIDRRKGAVVNQIGNKVTDDYIKKFKEELTGIAAEAYCRGMKEEDFIEECKKVFKLYDREE